MGTWSWVLKAAGREVGVVKGIWQERRLDSAGRQLPGRLRATRGDLYVFAGVQGPEAEALEHEICSRVADTYYRDGARSVTTSLTRALSVANEGLYAANQRAAPDDRRRAAVVCLVLRGEDAYLAHVGDALAYLVTPEDVRLLVRARRPLSHLPTGLGSAVNVDAELSHHLIDCRCSIILGVAPLAETAPPTALRQLLVLRDNLDVAVALRALLGASGSARDLRAVIVDVEGPARRPVSSEAEASGQPTEGPGGDREPAPPAPASEPPVDDALVEDVRPHGGSLAWENVRLGDRVVRALEMGRAAIRRGTSRASRLTRTLLILATVFLAIFAAVVVPLGLWQDRQEGVADVDLVARAEQKEREALGVEEPSQRLRLLSEASELAGKAARLRRGDAAAQAISRRIQTELDALSGAVRLGPPARLLILDGQPTQLVLGANDLYVLDRAVDRVYRYPLASDGQGIQPTASPVVLRRGDRFGDVVVAGPSRLLWMPAGSARAADALLVFDEAGALFEFDPSRGAKALRSAVSWRPSQVLAGYAGSLFVLDPLAGTLRWHPPGPDGYDRTAYPYLQPEVSASVGNGVSLAVDGDLYLLRANGRIDRFVTGRPLPFAGAVPDRPLGTPASLLATPRAVYVLDLRNRRLVEFDRDGGFRRQYLFESDDLVGIAVDEARGLLYYLGRQSVYLYRAANLQR